MAEYSFMRRRDFLKTSIAGSALCSLGQTSLSWLFSGNTPHILADGLAFAEEPHNLIEARYYKKLEHQEVVCELCPRECKVGDKERGYCGVRENRQGTYYTLVYNQLCAEHVDPIEKKPFYHFHPGSLAYSIATAGCNMNCKYCQNWDISQVRPEQVRSVYRTPGECARNAKEAGSLSISYTYTEPTIFYEYMYDTCEKARALGVKNVMVSAGYIHQRPLTDLCRVMDAIKIDFKAFTDSFYKEICGGRRQPVLDAMVTIHKLGVWLEIVYLVVPTLNDTAGEIRDLSKWILKELGPDIPIHLSRFHPTYLLTNLPPTPVDTLETLQKVAVAEGIHYAYVGNVPGHPLESTYCPKCRTRVVQRSGYNVNIENLEKGSCKNCGTKIPGVWA